MSRRGSFSVADNLSTLSKELPTTRLPLDQIDANPKQPRRFFDEAKLESLADSIRTQDVQHPILVRPVGERYEIVAGERRYRAAKLAGREDIPVVIRNLTDHEAAVASALENLQRENLSRLEEVENKRNLVALTLGIDHSLVPNTLRRMRNYPKDHAEAVEEVAKLFKVLGREEWTSFVTNGLPLLELDEELHTLMTEGRFSPATALFLQRAPREHRAALTTLALAGKSVEALERELASLTNRRDRTVVADLKRALSARSLARLSESERAEALARMEDLLARLTPHDATRQRP